MRPVHLDRVVLRKLNKDDLDAFFSYRSHPELVNEFGQKFPDQESCLSFIEETSSQEWGVPGKWIQLGIYDRDQKKIIGDIGLKPELYDVRIVELGITLSPDFQNMGFASEAVKGILKHLFTHENIHRVLAYTQTRNHAAVQLLERNRFRREGQTRKSYELKGEWLDEYLYAMLKEEWNS